MRWADPDPFPLSPAAIEDLDPAADGSSRPGPSVADGVDTDADGVPDTLVEGWGADLLLYTDLDGDGLADQVLRIGPDATTVAPDPPDDGAGQVTQYPGWWMPGGGTEPPG